MFDILIYLTIGVFAGLSSGLLGIGGGTITVPLLLWTFSFFSFPTNSLMHMAIGTSLASMVCNTLSALYFHYKKGNVSFAFLLPLLPGLLLGSLLGTLVVREFSSAFLRILFGLFSCYIGLLFYKQKNQKNFAKTSKSQVPIASWVTFVISFFANLLGVGGGSFLLPLLLYKNIKPSYAIGNSAACSFFISLLGTLGYSLLQTPESPFIPHTIGCIYLPAFISISLSSSIASYFGTKLSQ
ncbi:MAG: sulfite exporter TauE/SafE family protein, partial [Chlamydiae bacterium]|nr:sulfite exporter TauE/SafE family protein [Chlamydiota bacterium]